MILASDGLSDDRPVNVVIVANYTGDDSSSNNRFNELARRIAARGHEVELVTSDFSHAMKQRRLWPFGATNYRITHVHETGYHRNVSMARLHSQMVFAREVRRFLQRRAITPDIVYCATPPPSLAEMCGRYARSNGARFVVDVQDLWPDAFAMVAHSPAAVGWAFTRMRRASRTAYEAADLLVGVSQTYIESAARMSRLDCTSMVVYLGTDLHRFDACRVVSAAGVGGVGLPRIGYVGGLSRSYDLPVVIEAMRQLGSRRPELRRLELTVMGDGALRDSFQEQARLAGVSARFLGKLPYPEMVRQLCMCEIAINPIVRGSAGSVLNKACDYAAAALPVVSTQDSPEYRNLLEQHRAGINCATGDAGSVAMALERLIDDADERRQMSDNSRRMCEELFDRSRTYEALIDSVLALVGR